MLLYSSIQYSPILLWGLDFILILRGTLAHKSVFTSRVTCNIHLEIRELVIQHLKMQLSYFSFWCEQKQLLNAQNNAHTCYNSNNVVQLSPSVYDKNTLNYYPVDKTIRTVLYYFSFNLLMMGLETFHIETSF